MAFSIKISKIDRIMANLVFLNDNLKKKFPLVYSLGGIKPAPNGKGTSLIYKETRFRVRSPWIKTKYFSFNLGGLFTEPTISDISNTICYISLNTICK